MNRLRSLLLPLSGLALALMASAPAAALDFGRKVNGADDLLSADQAFKLVSAIRSADGIHLNWAIEPGYYLYRQRFHVEPVVVGEGAGAAALAALKLPKGESKHDEHFGDVEIYKTQVEAVLPLARGAAAPTQLKVRWQGCAEAGVCYPPVTRVVDVIAAP
ncbi:protein-disulfide reductase DsbD domain-containing protein [Nevskia sp.]|uniref:protein-disulfide reductase DsbD domain-containing protein n=1 Tax=Nevskia sp. TaxID=1929292 RepID=UPI0025EFA0C1|nr:protein-disulfide reductase DsbD domain-containing protein [Nevskia sp.]